MKIKYSAYFIALALAAGFSSCNDDTFRPETADKGSLNTASILTEVKNAEIIFSDNQSSVSRASYPLDNFIISVVDEQGVEVANWNYTSMPSLPTFPVGKYTVHASSGEVQPVAWETPFFTGSQNFEITKNQVTDVEKIVCKLANICVSVNFSDKLIENSDDDILVTVTSTKSDNSLPFVKSETRKGYFQAEGQETFEVHFTGTVMGNKEDFKFPLTNVAAGQHRKINFGINVNPNGAPDEFGNVNYEDGGINVSTEVEGSDLTSDTPQSETPLDPSDRPGKEDPETPDQPVEPTPDEPSDDAIEFTSSTLSFDEVMNPNDYDTGEVDDEGNGIYKDAIVNIKSEFGFASVKVVIDSEALTPSVLAGVGLRSEFDLATGLAPDGTDLSDGLAGLGFPIKEQITADGVTDIDFIITQFVPLIGIYSGNSSFIITVTDKKGNKNTLTLKFKS